ncbi:MAG TPA: aminodeoxychorismate synthase, component I [Methylomirabilota bacterium]|nr:aminodeoxychorismate synthase, component I [Methylomirabilota bacterium]
MAEIVHALEIPYEPAPLARFARVAERPYAALLDSAKLMDRFGRYSFLAVDPFSVLEAKDGRIALDGQSFEGDPFEVLRERLAGFPLTHRDGLPPFQTGAVGFLSYDLCHHLERLPRPRADDMGFPDLALGFYDVIAAWDHRDRRAFVLSSGWPEPDAAARRKRAIARSEWLARELAGENEAEPPLAADAAPAIQSNFSRPDYEAAVQRVIDYILAGDIFQANMTQRFRARMPEALTPFALYRRLMAINPAPFAAYLNCADTVIASASPERFLSLRNGWVETRPIKGTRPRGKTPDEDERLAAELLASEKDTAENVMIVDLLRNDLSRVCRDGSVTVPELCVLESYATVFHLVSTVVGQMRPDLGAVDLLRASFPGGSITGAPKIRAMEIIAELEPTQRGPYCGSVGWFGFDGGMDTSITIRTYAIKDGWVTFQAGGGIVADSDPAAEYEESLAKARALIAALQPPSAAQR